MPRRSAASRMRIGAFSYLQDGVIHRRRSNPPTVHLVEDRNSSVSFRRPTISRNHRTATSPPAASPLVEICRQPPGRDLPPKRLNFSHSVTSMKMRRPSRTTTPGGMIRHRRYFHLHVEGLRPRLQNDLG